MGLFDEVWAVAEVKKVVVDKLTAVGDHLTTAAVRNISTPPTPGDPSTGFPGKPHSFPGDYPFQQTENLKQSVHYEVDEDELSVKVGTDVDYGTFLEEGTKTMAARPWLVRTLDEEDRTITDILEA